MSKVAKILLAICVIIFALIGNAGAVFAYTALPDSVSIIQYYVNRNLVESGDFLLLVHYNIPYTATPTTSIDENFIFRLYDTTGTTELGTASPYPYDTLGYGQGVVSFYFDADSAPTWGLEYVVKITGVPGMFETVPSYEFTVPSSAYTSKTTKADNQKELGERVIKLARALGVAWVETLVTQQDANTYLSGDEPGGEGYFREAIPGLQVMAPDIFYMMGSEAAAEDRTWATNKTTEIQGRFNGTWVQDSIDGLGELFHLPTPLAWGIPLLILAAFMIHKSQKWWGTAYPGYIASAGVILCFSLLFLGLNLLALVAFFAAFLLGWIVIFKKA